MPQRLQTLLLLLLALPGLVLAPGQAFAVCLCDAFDAEGSCCPTVSADGCCGEAPVRTCCGEDRGVPSDDDRGGCDDSDGCDGCIEVNPSALADVDSTSPEVPESGVCAAPPVDRLASPPSFDALGRVTRPPPDPLVRHAGLLPGNAPLRL